MVLPSQTARVGPRQAVCGGLVVAQVLRRPPAVGYHAARGERGAPHLVRLEAEQYAAKPLGHDLLEDGPLQLLGHRHRLRRAGPRPEVLGHPAARCLAGQRVPAGLLGRLLRLLLLDQRLQPVDELLLRHGPVAVRILQYHHLAYSCSTIT